MRKFAISALALVGVLGYAQVGIGTTNPTVDLAIADDNTGLDVIGTSMELVTDGTTKLTVSSDGNVGIGMAPAKKLDVNGTLRFDNLGEMTNEVSEVRLLSYNTTSNEIQTRTISSTAGQFVRLPLTGNFTYSTGGEQNLNFDSSASPVNGISNVVNTVSGTSLNSNNITDLPAGTYLVTLRISGRFQNDNGANQLNLFTYVNGNYYTRLQGTVQGSPGISGAGPNSYLTDTYTDIIVLPNATNTLSFTVQDVTNDFTTSENFSGVARSILLLERIK